MSSYPADNPFENDLLSPGSTLDVHNTIMGFSESFVNGPYKVT